MSNPPAQDDRFKLTVSVRPSIKGEIVSIAETTGIDEEEVTRRLLNIALDRLDFDDQNVYALGAVRGGEEL
jgi:hypothetical protein